MIDRLPKLGRKLDQGSNANVSMPDAKTGKVIIVKVDTQVEPVIFDHGALADFLVDNQLKVSGS